MKSFRYTNKLS